jgi:chemotaxis signal transduction protein
MIQLADKQLILSVGEQSFGLAMRHVQEIIEVTSCTTIPLTQLPIRGLIQLRGAAMCLIDAGIALGQTTTPLPLPAAAVIISLGDLKVGLVVQRAVHVATRTSENSTPLLGQDQRYRCFSSSMTWSDQQPAALVINPDRLQAACASAQHWLGENN